MAITLKTNEVDKFGFIANGSSSDWSGCEEIVAAVSGKSIYIERIWISSESDEVFTFGAGETGGAVTTTIFGPVYSPGYVNLEYIFTRPLRVAAATSLVVDAASTATATIIVQGFIK